MLFLDGRLESDAYHLKLIGSADTRYLVVTADSDRGVLLWCLRIVATDGTRTTGDQRPRRGADASGTDPMGEPVGQPR